jgi:hypothetical protein
MRCKPGRCHFAGQAVVMALALGSDETQKSRPADPRLLDRCDDAEALVTGRSRRDLLCRSDWRLLAAGDGLPLRGKRARRPRARHGALDAPWASVVSHKYLDSEAGIV